MGGGGETKGTSSRRSHRPRRRPARPPTQLPIRGQQLRGTAIIIRQTGITRPAGHAIRGIAMLAAIPEDLLDVAQRLDLRHEGVHPVHDPRGVEGAALLRGRELRDPDLLRGEHGVQLGDLAHDEGGVRGVDVLGDDLDLVEAVVAVVAEGGEPVGRGEGEGGGDVRGLRVRGRE